MSQPVACNQRVYSIFLMLRTAFHGDGVGLLPFRICEIYHNHSNHPHPLFISWCFPSTLIGHEIVTHLFNFHMFDLVGLTHRYQWQSERILCVRRRPTREDRKNVFPSISWPEIWSSCDVIDILLFRETRRHIFVNHSVWLSILHVWYWLWSHWMTFWLSCV